MATKQREPWPKDPRPRDKCVVCGKSRTKTLTQKCECPWNKPFEHWPRGLLNTLQALVAGGPREP